MQLAVSQKSRWGPACRRAMKMQTVFNSLISIRFAIVATVAIFLSAIGGCTAAPDPPDRQSPAEQAPTSPAFASILEKYTEDVVALGAPSVHIQMNSRLGEWSKAVGVRSLENQEPAQLTDQVHIGDVTMSMVAVSVLKLVDEGKVRLDDPITQHLPELGDLINAPGAVSVRSLLNHRSGMPSYWEILLKSTPMREVLAKRMSYEERLAVAATVPWGTRADTRRRAGWRVQLLKLELCRLGPLGRAAARPGHRRCPRSRRCRTTGAAGHPHDKRRICSTDDGPWIRTPGRRTC